MSEFKYEYGKLYKHKEWGSYYWVFFNGNDYINFDRNSSFIECLNGLGRFGWKLCVKSDDNEYVFLKEKIEWDFF